MDVFSQNLRRFRLARHLTQEQAAENLGVSPQSVSRWERGTTWPDVAMLPKLARLYGVMIDDLYQEKSTVYANLASRLLSVYEASGKTEDFMAALEEFSRIPEQNLTADDLRGWGVLYHYMMKQSASEAIAMLDRAMAHPGITEDVFSSAAQQKIALMCDLGRGREEAARYDAELERNPTNALHWTLCTAAHYLAGEEERAMEVVREGIRRFPDKAALHVYAGCLCRDAKRYEDAFAHWERALELDPDFLDARYSMGFCLEEMGQYGRARKLWHDWAEDLKRRGFEAEQTLPRTREKLCAERSE